MTRDELQSLTNCTNTLRVHTQFTLSALMQSSHAEDHIISDIGREVGYRIIEHADIATFTEPDRDLKIYDVQVTTIPAGAWLKIVALLKKHVPVEDRT